MTTLQLERRLSTCLHEARHLAMAIATGQHPRGAQVGGLNHSAGIAVYRPPLLMLRADEAWTGALVSLAPHLDTAEWPLGNSPDEETVTAAVKQFAQKQDRAPREVFDELLADAQFTARLPVYKRLVVALSRVLELNGRLDQRGIAKVCGVVCRSFDDTREKGQDMQQLEHKTYTAEPVTTDQGIFEALVSTPTEDREGDVVVTGAFAATIANWRSSGKVMPLAWNHGTDPEDLVGHVDPAQMREEAGKGLIVGGKVDLETDRGRQVWKLLKSGSLGFSFGYLITDSVDRPGGGREITGLDLFEISATSVPMNSGTRVISTKSVAEREHEAIAKAFAQVFAAPSRHDHLADLSLAELKAYGDELTKDIDTRPIRIVSFEC